MPVNINLLPDEVIAKGMAVPDTSKLFDSYFQGSDQAQKQALQNLFAGGIPTDINGNVDYRKMAEMLATTGGAQALPSALGLLNQDYLQKLPPIGTTSPVPTETPPRPPPSIQSSGLRVEPTQNVASADTGGERLRPGQRGNTIDDGDITGISVDNQPTQATSFAPAAATSTAPSEDRYPPQFKQTPDTGPPTDRFAQVAQPQAQPRSQIPAVPAQQAGPYNEGLARQYDQERDNNLELARRAGFAGNKEVAEQYRQKAIEAAANAKMVREGLIGAQRKQAETQVEQEKAVLEEGKKGYATGKDIQLRLGLIDDSIKTLGPQWLGAGASARAGLARQYNTALQFVPENLRNEFGLKPFDPAKVASWEDFNKQTQQLGFALARTLGAREAMQIVQAATASVPNADQTYWGARLVSASMKQAAQREIDYHKYLIDLRRNGQSLLDADVTFNERNPVQNYVRAAISVVPPQSAINYLQANPTPQNKKAFDAKYGDGATIGVFGPNQ